MSTRIGFAVVAAFGFMVGWLCCFLDGVISSKSGDIAIGVPDAPPKLAVDGRLRVVSDAPGHVQVVYNPPSGEAIEGAWRVSPVGHHYWEGMTT